MNSFNSYDSAAAESPFISEFRELFQYRDLIKQLIIRNIKIRYKRSIIGIAWTLLNPILTVSIQLLTFSVIFKFSTPSYAIFLVSGIIAFNFFAQTTSSAMSETTWGGSIFSRIYIPKAILVISALGTSLINFLFSLIPLTIIVLWYRHPLRQSLFILPLSILILVAFSLGIGLMLAVLAVYFHDVVETYQLLISALYFLTPVFYPISIIAESRKWMFKYNPLYYIVEMFRQPIFDGHLPSPKMFIIATTSAVASLLIGWWAFTRKSREFAYKL
jgi:ABC-type polysaccharide/polyol phosphate export permease